MHTATRRSLRLMLACIALTGCSHNLVSDFDFCPPPHWVSTPAIKGRQFWMDPDDRHQVVMVVRPAEPLNESAGFGVRRMNIEICGNHPAVYYRIRSTRVGEEPSQIEWVDTSWNGQAISAVYVRPLGIAANPTAEQSIRTLCMKH